MRIHQIVRMHQNSKTNLCMKCFCVLSSFFISQKADAPVFVMSNNLKIKTKALEYNVVYMNEAHR